MISLEKVYQHSQVAAKIYQANYACNTKIVRKFDDALQEKPKSNMARLGQAAKLGVIGGTFAGTSHTSSTYLDGAISQYVLSVWTLRSLPALKRNVGFALPLPVQLLTLASIGTGTPNSLNGTGSSGKYRLIGDILQYGILGMPQATAVNYWRHHLAQNNPASASACLFAAVVINMPLEAARTAVALSFVATHCFYAALFSALSIVYNTYRWIQNPQQDPSSYALFSSTPLLMDRVRQYFETPKAQGGASVGVHRQTEPHEFLSTLISFLDPVFNAKSANEAHTALVALDGRIKEAVNPDIGYPFAYTNLMSLTQSLDSMSDRLTSLVEEHDKGAEADRTRVREEVEKIFAPIPKQERNASWLVSRHTNVALYLKPDNLQDQVPFSSPQIAALATSCFNMTNNLSKLADKFAMQSKPSAAH